MTRQNQIRIDIHHSIDLALELYKENKEQGKENVAGFWLGIADRYTKELLRYEKTN